MPTKRCQWDLDHLGSSLVSPDDDVCVSSKGSVKAGPALSKHCICCKLPNAQHRRLGTLYSKTLLTHKLLKKTVPSIAFLGGELPDEETNRVPY